MMSWGAILCQWFIFLCFSISSSFLLNLASRHDSNWGTPRTNKNSCASNQHWTRRTSSSSYSDGTQSTSFQSQGVINLFYMVPSSLVIHQAQRLNSSSVKPRNSTNHYTSCVLMMLYVVDSMVWRGPKSLSAGWSSDHPQLNCIFLICAQSGSKTSLKINQPSQQTNFHLSLRLWICFCKIDGLRGWPMSHLNGLCCSQSRLSEVCEKESMEWQQNLL